MLIYVLLAGTTAYTAIMVKRILCSVEDFGTILIFIKYAFKTFFNDFRDLDVLILFSRNFQVNIMTHC